MIPGRLLPRAKVHRALTLLALLFTAFLAVRGTLKGFRPGGNDFTIYHDSARALLAGQDPLSVPGSIYLPSFDVLLVPFGLLPHGLALGLWQALSLLALVWAWRRSLELLGPALLARPWAAWAPLLAVSRLADSTFAYGQVNTITLALVVEAAVRWRARRTFATATAIGIGTALKILPAGLCVWLALRGARRAAAASALVALAWVVVLPLAAMGPTRAAASFASWRAGVLAPFVAGGETLLAAREYVPGQSLGAACYRTFSATPATSEGHGGLRANLFDWPLAWTHRLVAALTLAHLVLWALLARATPLPVHRARDPDADAGDPDVAARDLLLFALALTMILALAPIVHKAHMVWLLPVYAALLGLPSAARGAARHARFLLTGLSIALIAGTSPALLGDGVATRLLGTNVVFLGLECALAALALELRARRRFLPSPG